jgi:hypothetical protein
MKLDFCVSHNYTQRDLPLPPSLLLHHHHHHRDSVEIPPKTRCKQKQNETHYENITHFIHLTLKNTILGVLHNLFIYTHTIIYVKRKGGSFLWS